MHTAVNFKNLVDRFLCRSAEEQNLDQYGFLCGHIAYKDSEVTVTMDNYYTYETIKSEPFCFIIGNGGLGKTTFLNQIEEKLALDDIKIFRLNLRNLSSELSLTERIEEHLIEKDDFYIILDAVDEAIDIGIINISEIIKDAIETCLKINSNIKTIITSRDNRLSETLVENLKEAYKKVYEKVNNNKFYLCVLTENDVKNISESNNCTDTSDFINKIKEFNLGCFASSPITLKPLIEMYNKGLLSEEISHYDIYENLMNYICEESEFRKEKDSNNELKQPIYATENILFVASKIAIELKFKKKNYVTKNSSNSEAFDIAKLYNQKYKLPNNAEILITKELIEATLKTKIFYKSEDKYYIAQQTYFDFLCARYIHNMELKPKELFQVLKVSDNYHPLLTEAIAFLATKKDFLFKDVIIKIPERILLSSVNFTKTEHKKQLFKAYLKLEKNKIMSFWNTFYNRKTFYKRISYSGMENDIHKLIITTDDKIKEILLNIIGTNKYKSFTNYLDKTIFNSKSNINLKIDAISAASECQDNELLKKIASNIDSLKNTILEDSHQQLLGMLLFALCPNYIDTDEMLNLIEEEKTPHYHGMYGHFLSTVLPYQVTESNHLKFLNWIKTNPLKGVVKCIYGSGYDDTAKKIFKNISKYITIESIPDIVEFHLQNERYHGFFSEDIFKKISENQALRCNFIKQIIIKINNPEQFRSVFWDINTLCSYTEDIKFFLNLYDEETCEKNLNCYEQILNNYYNYYLQNNNTSDIELIYPIINRNEKLKKKFGYFINPVELSPVTLEPLNEVFQFYKKQYYENIERQEKEKKRKENILNESNIEEHILSILNDKTTKINNITKIIKVFNCLNISEEGYRYINNYNLDINKHKYWNILNDTTKNQILNLVIQILLDKNNEKYYKIDEHIQKGELNSIWKTFALLPLIKELNQEQYKNILLYWSDAIVYSYTENEKELLMKQNLIKDIYGFSSNKIKSSIKIILLNSQSSLRYNFFNSFESIWNPELSNWLYHFFSEKTNKIDKNVIKEIIAFLAVNKYEKIKDYIKNRIQTDEDNKTFLLGILAHNFPKEWSFIKNEIKKSSEPSLLLKEIARPLENMICYEQGSILKNFSPVQLSEFYDISINLCSDLSKNKELGVHSVDYLKELIDRIPQLFVDHCEKVAFLKIKKAYLKNRKNKSAYKKYYNKMLEELNYNIYQKSNLNNKKLAELENKYTRNNPSIIYSILNHLHITENNGTIICN